MRKSSESNRIVCSPIAQQRNNWLVTVWRWERWTQPSNYLHASVISNTNCLVFCESGSATYHLGPEEFHAGPGSLVFLPCERAYLYKVDPGQPYCHCLVHLDLRDGHGISPVTLDLVPRICMPPDPKAVLELFNNIEAWAGVNSQPANLRMNAAVLELLAILMQNGTPKRRKLGQSVGKAYEALAIMEQRFRGPLSIKEIAHELQVTPEYLAVSFRKTFYVTPKLQIRNLRLTYAASLLFTTDKLVKEIAAETGFQSVSVFEAAFRQYFKCSTSHLAQQIKPRSGPTYVYRPAKK